MGISQQSPGRDAGLAPGGAYAPREVLARHKADGTIILQCCIPLTGVESSIVNYLEQWATERPEQVFLAQRLPDRTWETINYAESWRRVQGIAQGLIEAGHAGEQAVMILSPASIEHGLLMLAAMLIGAPVVPVSPAYSLLPEARVRLQEIGKLIEPAFVFVQAETQFGSALQAPELADAVVLSAAGGVASFAISKWYDLVATDEVVRRRGAPQPHCLPRRRQQVCLRADLFQRPLPH